MIPSVISVPTPTVSNKKPVGEVKLSPTTGGSGRHDHSTSSSSRQQYDADRHADVKSNAKRKSPGGGSGEPSTSSAVGSYNASPRQPTVRSQIVDPKKNAAGDGTSTSTTNTSAGKSAHDGVVDVTGIDLVMKLKWPTMAIRHTESSPSISYSCNPSFYDHNIVLTQEEEKKRTELFVISDLLDDMVDYVKAKRRSHHRHHHRSVKKMSSKQKKSKKSKHHKTDKKPPKDVSTTKGQSTEVATLDTSLDTGSKGESSKHGKKHKSKKHKRRSERKHSESEKTTLSKEKSASHKDKSHANETTVDVDKASDVTKVSPSKVSPHITKVTPSTDGKEAGESTRNSQQKSAKKKRSSKKKLSVSVTEPSLSATIDDNDKESSTGPSPKKPKTTVCKPETTKAATAVPTAAAASVTSQKISIQFSQNAKSALSASSKSKWDTSSDEEGSSRKGAISYHFSEESDTEPEQPQKVIKKATEVGSSRLKVLDKMQPGGMLKTIELHNPLPDTKPAVPLAHPNPGPGSSAAAPDAASAPAASSGTTVTSTAGAADGGDTRNSKSRSRSRSRSRSSSRSSYSSDDSYYRSRRKRKRGRRRRRSYSTSYSRSRSRSYSSYSRSHSRSYSRSYSRSTSRSRSRSYYRSSSRSSYSYSSSSSYSRSRSRSPRYTRAVQPAYVNPRPNKGGRRRGPKKNRNQFKNQGPQNNPQIRSILEKGRAKAEETVMKLKRQKEEQRELHNKAMATIAAAASSAGVTLPTSTQPVTTTAKPANSGKGQNGGAKNQAAAAISTTASAGGDVPNVSRPLSAQQREFIGPVRPGVDPEGAAASATLNGGQEVAQTYEQREPTPMQAPDTEDAMYKTLQEQAAKHMMANSATSPADVVTTASIMDTPDQIHQLAVAQFNSQVPTVSEGQIMIDPMTMQPVQISAASVQMAALHHQQQLAASTGAHTPVSDTPRLTEDGKPAPHEAVIRSYADQVIMSNHKALVSQSQPVFAVASVPSVSIAQPTSIQSGTPLMMNHAAAAAHQFQMNQLAQLQHAQLQQQQMHAAQMQQAQQAQLQQLQLQQAAALGGLGFHPQLHQLAQQQQQSVAMHQLLAQQQLLQQAHAAQQQQQQQQQQPQIIQLPNGQILIAQQPHNLALLQRFGRPM